MARRLPALILTLTMILMMFNLSAFAAVNDLDECELRYDGESWKVYTVDNIDDTLTLNDLKITVVDGNNNPIDPSKYDLLIGIENGWSEEDNEMLLKKPEYPYGIIDPEVGFSTYGAFAIPKDGSGFTKPTKVQSFMIWHKYSFNWFGANADFGEEYEKLCTWSWHSYFEVPANRIEEPVIHGIDYSDPDPENYEITYFRRVTGVPVSDDDDYQDRVYPEDEPLEGLPTEQGSYFARIDGKSDYYGTSYVDFDIVESEPKCLAWVRGEEEPYYDGDYIYMTVGQELDVCFTLDPPVEGLIPGWRDDLFKSEYFDIAYNEIDGVSYAHITALKPGKTGTLYYSFYQVEDIFGETAVGWKDAVPVYSASVNFDVANILGDTDGDGTVTILDATAIQRYLVNLPTANFVMLSADADRDGIVSILDATAIQRKIAGLPAYQQIDEEVTYGTYFAAWNMAEELLPEGSTLTGAEAERAREDIRKAMNLLVDRGWIVNEIFPEGITRLPADSFVAKWVTDANGSEFHKSYFNADDYEGNVSSAVETLKKYYDYDEESGKFTNVPELTYLFNTGGAHQTIANKIRNDFDAVGITLHMQDVDWGDYMRAVSAGEYSLARDGWVIDHDDPMEFLEMWLSDSESWQVSFDGSMPYYSIDLSEYGVNFKVENGTWAEVYDRLIGIIRECDDRELAYQLMHVAEDILMDTGCVMPIYYY